MNHLCILGRQPALGLAELESRFGADKVQPIADGNSVILSNVDTPIIYDNLGGILKAGKVLTTINTTKWDIVSNQLRTVLNDILQSKPDGKTTLGISVYGLQANPRQINAAALGLKKVIKASGRSARVVPNSETDLNSAQVLHNKLAETNGIELLLVRNGQQTVIAQTVWVQDIEAYRRRDQERPARDARIGMLPPKLAQIIISLAVSNIDKNTVETAAIATSLKNNENEIADKKRILQKLTLLDPFCGTGVVLQETLLQGHNILGSDLEPRMVEYSQKNIKWLLNSNQETDNIEVKDATTARWPQQFDTIACETYLGRPFSSQPDQQTLTRVIQDTNTIHKKFLNNIARQTTAGFRMCIAVPAWHTKNGFKRLPFLDHLSELGYNRISFVHADTTDLIYHRQDQIVARELVVLIRK